MPKQPKTPPAPAPVPPKASIPNPDAVNEDNFLRQFEYTLAASLDPEDPGEIQLSAMLDLFSATVYDAYKRKFTDDNFSKVLLRNNRVHTLGANLEAAVLYSKKLKELGYETPNIDATIKEILATFLQLRKEAVDTLKLCLQMKPSAVTPS